MSRRVYLTKSDFKRARECPTKLYYRKKGYPSRLDDDPYLAFLADGGFMVETMARQLYPEGVTIDYWEEPEEADRVSRRAVTSGDGTWFEPTFIDGPFLVRVDILRRRGNELDLIEVKSSSVEPVDDLSSPFRGSRGGILSQWVPYLEDVTFQWLVLQSAFPGLTIKPHLCVVDKTSIATAATTYENFRMVAPPPGEPRSRAEFRYLGSPDSLRTEHLLAFVEVTAEANELRDEIARAREEFAASIDGNEIHKIASPPRYECKKCEFRLKNVRSGRTGFDECWGPLAQQEPHILDLYRVDLLGGRSRDLPREMASRGDVRLTAIPGDAFGDGKSVQRQKIQVDSSTRGKEWIAPRLRDTLREHPYPLHFIDFEGSRIALPYHVGMRPYEQVGFQWSCHSIREPGGQIQHAEWLNDSDAFPNFEFARSLMEHLGNSGTVYIWSPYEMTMLRDVREQMIKYEHQDPELGTWLDAMESSRGNRIIDLCAMARESYFHPEMRGSVSIKAVFPAIWRHHPRVRKLSCFRGFRAGEEDPYQQLPTLPVGDDEEVVREGTGAIRIYQDMMFGLAGQDPESHASLRKLLLQYCHLDTAAVVAIWWRWCQTRQSASWLGRWFGR